MCIIVWKNVNNRVLKCLLLGFIVVPSGFTCIIYIISYFFTLPNIFLKVLNSQNIFVNIYWILFIALFLLLVFKYLKFDKKIVYFLIVVLITGGAMMMSPIWGGRTASITTFMLFMVIGLCFKKIDPLFFDNKWVFILGKILIFTFMILFTIYSIYIYYLNILRNKYINYQLENSAKEIEVIILPSYYTWNLNTWGSDGDFAYNFKAAYGIDRDMELIYVSKDDTSVDVDKIEASSKMKG